MKIDLHLHSCYSGDGIHKVGTLVNLFSPGDIIALTDHETIAGWGDFEIECNKHKINPIFGVEWFAGYSHILSYFPSRNIPKPFNDFIHERRIKENATMRKLVQSLKQEDDAFPSFQTLISLKYHPEDILGMMVLGCQLRKHKKLEFKEAIYELREKKKSIPNYPKLLEPIEIIDKMTKWGAISILAHPFRRKDCDDNALKKFYKLIIEYKKAGLMGIELHPFEEELNEKIKAICKRLDLIWTIGSDYHCYKEGIYPSRLNGDFGDILTGLKKVKLV